MHLPDAPAPAKPWGPPPGGFARHLLNADGAGGAAVPQHCGQREQARRMATRSEFGTPNGAI